MDHSHHEETLAIMPTNAGIDSSDILNASFVSLVNYSSITFYDPDEPLKDFLTHDFESVAILCHYENNPNKILADDMRTALVRFVINREVNIALRNANFQVGKQPLDKFVIDRARFQKLADEIHSTFNEESGLYYTPFYQEGDTRVNPSGKLWERYNEVKKKMRDAGMLKKSTPKAIVHSKSVVLADEETLAKIEWLKTNVQPIDKVKEYWSDTFDERFKKLKDNNKSESTLTIYECLRTEIGVDLISIDFGKLKPKVTDNCIDSNWPAVGKAVKEYYSVNDQLLPNTTAQKLLSLLPNVSEDENGIILLLLLNCILDNTSHKSATVKKISKKRKNVSGETPPKASKDSEDLSLEDLKNDFLSIVKIETQVNELIEQKKKIRL